MSGAVRVRFAFYHEYQEHGFDPEPSYFVFSSDNPKLPVHGNVGMDQLHDAGVPVPLTPTFPTWVMMGRPKCAGGDAAI